MKKKKRDMKTKVKVIHWKIKLSNFSIIIKIQITIMEIESSAAFSLNYLLSKMNKIKILIKNKKSRRQLKKH